jgi:hypothetical protein
LAVGVTKLTEPVRDVATQPNEGFCWDSSVSAEHVFWFGQLVSEIIHEAERSSELKWRDWPDVSQVVKMKLNAKVMTKQVRVGSSTKWWYGT